MRWSRNSGTHSGQAYLLKHQVPTVISDLHVQNLNIGFQAFVEIYCSWSQPRTLRSVLCCRLSGPGVFPCICLPRFVNLQQLVSKAVRAFFWLRASFRLRAFTNLTHWNVYCPAVDSNSSSLDDTVPHPRLKALTGNTKY